MKANASEAASMSGERPVRRSRRGRGARRLAAAVAALFLIGALPAAAGAADYCIAPKTGCEHDVDSLTTALDAADDAPDADRVLLGAGTYTAPTISGFTYDKAGSPVEIAGAGEGQTIITTPGGPTGLWLIAGAGSSIHDLTIRLPQNAQEGFEALFTDTTARRIQVVEDPVQANRRYGVNLHPGGILEDSSVTLGGVQESGAVLIPQSGATVRRSALSARIGVLSYGGTIEQTRVTGVQYGIRAFRDATAINDSLIRLTGASGVGIYATSISLSAPKVTADGVTIVGPNLPDIGGVGVSTGLQPDQSAELSLTNSIIRGVATPISAAAGGSAPGTVSVSYSDYDPSGNISFGASAKIIEANVSNLGDAGFVDGAGGDYHLRAGSQLLDTGDPATAQGLDLEGNPLVADGNADGMARRDLGAFELQPAPVAQPAGGAGQPGGAPRDTQAPLLSSFKATPSLFALARARTALASRVPRGTHFRYTLSEQARVTLTIQRALRGRRAGHKCAKPTTSLRRAKRCTRYRTIGELSRLGNSGANSTRFTGRLAKRALLPGRYRAVIKATDAAGNRSASRTTRFRVAAS
jgi:hypothetical protein